MNAINTYPDEILVVDDSSASLKLLEDILGNAGYRVRLANDGELALRSARIQPPALVLLDIRMPGMDGYEVCRRLKDDEKTRSIPLIFLSILEDEGEKVKAFQAGGVDFITKPIHGAEVLARVNTHLALRHAQLDLERRNAELEAARETLEERVREHSLELEQVDHKLREQIAEHLHTLEALLESEAKYRRIVDTANEGIWMIGEDLLTTFVNWRMAEMLGYAPEEMIGQPFTDFMFEEDIPHHLLQIEDRRQGIKGQYERRFRRKDGRMVWTLASASPLLDEQRRFEGSFAMFTDITERKRVEDELRAAHQQLSNIIDFLPDATFVIDQDKKVIAWNRAVEEMTGTRKEDILGKGDYAYSIPWYGERRPILIDFIEADYPEFQSRYKYIHKQGNTVFAEAFIPSIYEGRGGHMWLTAAPILDSEGKQVGAIESVRDITDYKEAERKLILLNFALNNVHDEAYLIDEKACFRYVNDESCRALGYDREELLALNVADVDPDFPLERWPGHWRDIMEQGSMIIESRHKTREGRIYPVEISANYFEYNGQGYNLALARNIAERKQAEEALRKLNEELEERVRERTAELEAKNAELARLNKIFIGRELRMVELKEKIRELEERVGERS